MSAGTVAACLAAPAARSDAWWRGQRELRLLSNSCGRVWRNECASFHMPERDVLHPESARDTGLAQDVDILI
jgi:hypothetical protein